MIRFLLRRLLAGVVTLVLAVTVAFFLSNLTGDPARQILGPSASQEQVDQKRHELGLDAPLGDQYRSHLGSALTFDLGDSLLYRSSNWELIKSRLGWSVQLAVSAMVLGTLAGFPLGLLAAYRRDSTWDRLASGLSLLGQSMPAFWLGLLLILVFAVNLGWLPSGQTGSLRHLVLPSVTLALVPLAQVARITRSRAIDVLSQEYVVAARARGFHPARVLFRQVVRGTVLPVMTVVGLQLGGLLSTAVTVEFVFGWPGLGSLAATAVNNRDYTLVQALVTFGAFLFVAINLLVDVAYSVVDPRVRQS